MNFVLLTLIFLAFMFAMSAFALALFHYLQKALVSNDALVIDTPEEAMERREWLDH